MRVLLVILALMVLSVVSANPASAQTETNFRVSVLAEDAAFIGTAMGGARIIITDRRTGDILVQGVTYGGSQGTDAVLAGSRERNAQLISEDTASFEFSIDLVEPTPVTVTATAPLAQAQSIVSVSRDMLLLPGKDYNSGNGILLEIPGFTVDILSPPVNLKSAADKDEPIQLVAHVAKLCGCKLEKGSSWPPERYEVEAHIYRDNIPVASVPLDYANEAGMFAANLKKPAPGTYRIEVTAYDPVTKEAGMDSTSVVFTK